MDKINGRTNTEAWFYRYFDKVKGHEQKKCFYCGSDKVQKYGHVNGVQRYRCWCCGKQFLGGKRIDTATITDTETGKSHYTHKRLRSAYLSIKRNLPLLFTWYDYIEMGIPNTTNLIDGHFSHLKRMLRNHNGMTRERREKLVIGFFEASRGKSQ